MIVDIPSAIDDYNHYKGGVDIADQYREAYFTQQTSRRNWLPLFYWLLDTAIINAYLLACSTTASGRQKPPVTHTDFRLEIAFQLIDSSTFDKPRKRAASNQRKKDHLCYSKSFGVTEVPVCMPSHQIEKALKRRECVNCRFLYQQHDAKFSSGRKRQRAPISSYACTLCGLYFCKDCIAKQAAESGKVLEQRRGRGRGKKFKTT